MSGVTSPLRRRLYLAAVIFLGTLNYLSDKPERRVTSTKMVKNPRCDHRANSTTMPRCFPRPPDVPVKKKNYVPFWLLVSKKRRLAVTFTPKVMCTSLRDAFNQVDCVGTSFPEGCCEARKNKDRSYTDLSNYTRVIFFRDPIERTLSAYYNSKTNSWINVDGCESAWNCSLEVWVDKIYQARQQIGVNNRHRLRKELNEHFLTQKEVSQMNIMHYHYRLRMSNPVDQDFFWTQLMQFPPLHRNSNSDTKNSKSKLRQDVVRKFAPVTNETMMQIYRIYRDDFDLWEQMLAVSPRQPGEYSMYDYFKDHYEKDILKAINDEAVIARG